MGGRDSSTKSLLEGDWITPFRMRLLEAVSTIHYQLSLQQIPLQDALNGFPKRRTWIFHCLIPPRIYTSCKIHTKVLWCVTSFTRSSIQSVSNTVSQVSSSTGGISTKDRNQTSVPSSQSGLEKMWEGRWQIISSIWGILRPMTRLWRGWNSLQSCGSVHPPAHVCFVRCTRCMSLSMWRFLTALNAG